MELNLCVAPELPDETAHAGRYTGSVLIDDPRVTGGASTFTIQMKAEEWWLVIGTAILAWVIGFGAAMVTGVGLSAKSLKAKSVWKAPWPRTLAAAGAAVVAVSGVVMAQYVRDPSWPGGLELTLALFATCVAAAYGAGNATGSLSVKPAAAPD